MRTITQNTAGGPEVLVIAEIDDPTPGPGEVLVRVSAAGINPVDAAVRAGYYPLLGKPPFTVGWDISGTVEAIGPGVSELCGRRRGVRHAALPQAGGRLCRESRRAGSRTGYASRTASTMCRQARCRWPASPPGKASSRSAA